MTVRSGAMLGGPDGRRIHAGVESMVTRWMAP